MLLLWPLFSWISVARRSGRERGRRSGYQMSQMRSSSSSASFVEEILVEEAWDLVNNGTPRSVALKGGKGWRVRNGVCVCE